MLLLGFPECLPQARQLAQALNCRFGEVEVHRFPDGESLVTLPTPLEDTVVFFRSLHEPNTKLVELLLAFAAARANGCKRIILIAPYLGYMRQDIAFKPGQAVSQRIIGEWLSQQVDDLITVDPHLHRIQHLEEAFPHCRSIATSAAPLLGAFVKSRGLDGVLVGPDDESRQWVEQVAVACGLDYVIASKERLGDREVRVTLPACDYRGRDAILVDDVISSGRTMVETAQQLLARGAANISALCTHALFAPGAREVMANAGIGNIWSSNSIADAIGDAIPDESSCIDLTPLLAAAVIRLGQV